MIFISFIIQYCFTFKDRHPNDCRPIVDYDTASLILPSALLGVKFGVIINETIPDPLLICLLFGFLINLAYMLYI